MLLYKPVAMPSIVELEGGQFVMAGKKEAEDFKSWLLLLALYLTTFS